MLHLRQLCKNYGGVKAVDQVSLEVAPGEMVGVIGRPGAGKSTLLRMIDRLIEPTSGRIEFEGTNVGALKGRQLLRWRSHCGTVFQQIRLAKCLDVLTNVLIDRLRYSRTLPTLFKMFSMGEKAKAFRALHLLDMVPTAFRRAGTLSGGQQRRVAIARALVVQEPKLLLADEPIAALDPLSATKVMDALKSVNRNVGVTVICTFNDLSTAPSYFDRIIAMRAGRILFDGDPAEFSNRKVPEIYGTNQDSEEMKQVRTMRSRRSINN